MTNLTTAALYIWTLLVPGALLFYALAGNKLVPRSARAILTIAWVVIVVVGALIVLPVGRSFNDWQRGVFYSGCVLIGLLTCAMPVAWIPNRGKAFAAQNAPPPVTQPAASSNWTAAQNAPRPKRRRYVFGAAFPPPPLAARGKGQRT